MGAGPGAALGEAGLRELLRDGGGGGGRAGGAGGAGAPPLPPEHASWRRARGALAGGRWRELPGLARAGEVPRVRAPFPPAAGVTQRFLRGEEHGGGPAVFEGLAAAWPALGPAWDWDRLLARIGPGTRVVANNRAPARARDSVEACGREVWRTTFGEYVKYLRSAGAPDNATAKRAPLYLNGWGAFTETGFGPGLCADVGWSAAAGGGGLFPEVFEDDSFRAMLELDLGLKVSESAGGDPQEWVGRSDRMLNKVFVGPAGCITRLHFDAHGAHGWLAQVRGRKLFVLVPPGDSEKLGPFHHGAGGADPTAGSSAAAGATERSQSPIDPLDPDFERFPGYRDARIFVAVCRPGDVILIPRGWWHYAVSLDPGVTVMRNFWSLTSGNVRSLVEMFVGGVKKVIRRRQTEPPE